jgi:hypothetical protein
MRIDLIEKYLKNRFKYIDVDHDIFTGKINIFTSQNDPNVSNFIPTRGDFDDLFVVIPSYIRRDDVEWNGNTYDMCRDGVSSTPGFSFGEKSNEDERLDNITFDETQFDTHANWEPPCHHPNKYINKVMNTKFWVCPDCGADLGDAD